MCERVFEEGGGADTDKTQSSLPIQIGPQGFRVLLTNGCLVTAASQRTGMTQKTTEEEAVFNANTNQSSASLINKVITEWEKVRGSLRLLNGLEAKLLWTKKESAALFMLLFEGN